MRCQKCGKGPMDGVTIYRANEKVVPGIWRCEVHLDETAFKTASDPAIIAIDNAMNGRKPLEN